MSLSFQPTGLSRKRSLGGRWNSRTERTRGTKRRKLCPLFLLAGMTFFHLGLDTGSAQVLGAREQTPPSSSLILVAQPVQISGFESGTYWWAHMDASLSKPGTIMVCGTRTIPERNAAEGFVYVSTDFGKTWRQTLVDASTAWVSEQSCAFGPNRKAYFVSSSSVFFHGLPHHNLGRSRLYSSLDDGSTWQAGAEWPFLDYSSTAVGTSEAFSEDPVYVFANDVDTHDPASGPGLLTVTPSKGYAIHSVTLARNGQRGQLISAAPTGSIVLDDGTVAGVFLATRSAEPGPRPWTKKASVRQRIEVVVSHDGGHSLESPAGISLQKRLSQLSEPTIAVDRSSGPHYGRLYVAWAENSAAHIAIRLGTSDDGGLTWHQRLVETLPDRPRQLGLGSSPGLTPPAVAVSHDGTVGIFWIEREGLCPYFAFSRNGGDSFGPKVQIESCDSPPHSSSGPGWYGHYLFTWPASEANEQGAQRDESRVGLRIEMRVRSLTPTSMVADDRGDFHPMWLALRAGGSQLWTTVIAVSRHSTHAHKGPLPGLVDISPSVALEFTNNEFDPTRKTFSVDVRLVNRGSAALAGPLLLRPLRVTSSLGGVDPRDPALESAAPCQWTAHSSVIDLESLAPGERTNPVRVSVTLRDVRQTDRGEIGVSLRVCGRRP